MPDHTPQLPLYPTEEWRNVVGFEGFYEVSNLGRVRSVGHITDHGRYKGRTRMTTGKILGQDLNGHGYFNVVMIVKPRRQVSEVHRLVAEAFIGALPQGYHTHHKDKNQTNNHVDNLEYISSSEHHHLHNRGEGAHKAVLTRDQVIEIRNLLAQGLYQREIAKQYGVSRSTIGEIHRGASWAWLEGNLDSL